MSRLCTTTVGNIETPIFRSCHISIYLYLYLRQRNDCRQKPGPQQHGPAPTLGGGDPEGIGHCEVAVQRDADRHQRRQVEAKGGHELVRLAPNGSERPLDCHLMKATRTQYLQVFHKDDDTIM